MRNYSFMLENIMPVNNKTDILIIGAGICGLYAAHKLLEEKRTVCVLEAGSRVGGRIETVLNEFCIPYESGAEFIHGKLPLTKKLVKEAGARIITQSDAFYQAGKDGLKKMDEMVAHQKIVSKKLRELTEDMSLSVFMDKYLNGGELFETRNSLARMAEGFDVADIEKLSIFFFREELEEASRAELHRVEGGYGGLIQHLYSEIIKRGGKIITGAEVKEIFVQNDLVNAKCSTGDVKKAERIIVTVPIGILTSDPGTKGHITFGPQLTNYIEAAKKIGYGPVVKASLQFQSCIWNDEKFAKELRQIPDLGFLFCNERFPVWWTQSRDLPLITGWVGGPKAKDLSHSDNAQLLDMAIQSLAAALDTTEVFIQSNISAWHISNWGTRPFFEGAYSYNTTESTKARKLLNIPVNNLIYFAGEALNESHEIGTVEAALQSAEQVVKKILA
jgi:monoamine oxidase